MLPGWAGREFPWENGRLPAKFSFFFLLIYLVYRHFSLFLFLAFNYCLLPLRIEGGTINGFTRFSGPVFQLPAPIVVWAGWTAFHSIANVVLHTQGRKEKEPRWLVVKTSVSVCIFAYWEASCLWEKSSSVRREKETGGGQVTKGGGVDCIYTRREYLQGCCVQKNRSVGHSSGNPILTAIIEMMMAVFSPLPQS